MVRFEGSDAELSDVSGRTGAPLSPQLSGSARPPTNLVRQPTTYNTLSRLGPRRKRTVKLGRSGNFVLEEKLPQTLLNRLAYGSTSGPEFSSIRYTACTSDPDNFVASRYTLRASTTAVPTELAIVVTLYNEGIAELTRTLFGIFQNIQYTCQKNKRGWNADGWRKIVVIIVADGRTKVNPSVLLGLQTMGIYMEGVEQSHVNGVPTSAHIYESTSQLCLDPKMNVWTTKDGIPPVNFIFCLKEKNAKKINSHRWFFNAFCTILQPRVCVLLDVGTRPTTKSIYRLHKTFLAEPNLAGACGEIKVDMSNWKSWFNPLVQSQNFEYKISNHLDKSLESVFGYIGVLPGAFSAYRYQALLDNMPGRGPLSSYFRGEEMHKASASETSTAEIFSANLYLAEDRILALELVAKPGSKWLLKYVKNAAAETDVPDTVPEFISQRRRWLNGSFFAQVYAVGNLGRMLAGRHSIARKFVFLVQAIYSFLTLVFTFLGPSQFATIFYFLFSFELQSLVSPRVATAFFLVYPTLLAVLFIASLGNRPQASKWIYKLAMIFFGAIALVMAALLVLKIINLVKDFSGLGLPWEVGTPASYLVSLGATYLIPLVGSLLQRDPWHMITSLPFYLVMLPSYINVLQIYAFCNLHDVSWGTKGDSTGSELPGVIISSKADSHEVEAEVDLVSAQDRETAYDDSLRELKAFLNVQDLRPVDPRTKQEDQYKSFRTNLLLTWLTLNCVVFGVATQSSEAVANGYIVVLLFATASIGVIRLLGVMFYLFINFCTTYCCGGSGPARPRKGEPGFDVPLEEVIGHGLDGVKGARIVGGNWENGFVVVVDKPPNVNGRGSNNGRGGARDVFLEA
ncbi:chitin synthase-domain-containing protein [Gaertneriomyces semiglobifer]|nr:chitin synthase-domain-containing protein [Gaertneriomyces semiglobifer]